MASYSQVSYGSSGSDVKKLQTLLNNNGYSLDVDGIFGSKTQSAVRDYQSKNNLAVDGIVGTNTWGSLTATPSNTTNTNAATSNTTTTQETKKPVSETVPAYEAAEYKESDAVAQAYALLQQQMANQPGAYESKWQQNIDSILSQIQNRDKFSYNLDSDALYQQYADQYTLQGQQAMMDTMGQAAALTGGYGNSYAQTAGQQTYQGYLQQLNEVVPELYQMALDQYNQEGQDLYNQYALYGEQEAQDYSRYRDQVSDYNAELDRLYNQYMAERELDYSKYTDDRNFGYSQYRDQIADAQWQEEYDEALRQYQQSYQYQLDRDAVEDEQWQKEFEEAQRQFNLQYGASSSSSSSSGSSSSSSKKSSSSSSSGKSSSSSSSSSKSTSSSSSNNNYYEALLGAASTAKGKYSMQNYTARTKTYQETAAAISAAYNEGKITQAQKSELLRIATPASR